MVTIVRNEHEPKVESMQPWGQNVLTKLVNDVRLDVDDGYLSDAMEREPIRKVQVLAAVLWLTDRVSKRTESVPCNSGCGRSCYCLQC